MENEVESGVIHPKQTCVRQLARHSGRREMSHLSGHMRIYGLESALLSQSRKGFKTDPHPEAPLSRVDVAYNGDNGDNWIMQKKMETTIMGYIGIIG